MAAIENAPLATPRTKTLARSGQYAVTALPPKPANARPASAMHEATQPHTVHTRSEPKPTPNKRRPANAASSMPASMPPCCTPESCVDSPGVKPNITPANGSRIRSCAL